MYEWIRPELVYFVIKTCDSDWGLQNHHMMGYSLTFVIKGTAEYEINGKTYHVQTGDCIYVAPDSVRSARTEGFDCVAVDFVLPEIVELPIPTILPLHNMESFHHLFHEIKAEWLQRGPGHKMKLQAILMLILYKIIYEQSKGTKNIHVEKMKAFILQNYQDNISMKSLSEHVKLSPTYCGVLFKQWEDCTISEYINRIRINEAMVLLEMGDLNISEVALKSGFKDIYYFSNTFKKMIGLSPSKYRSEHIGIIW